MRKIRKTPFILFGILMMLVTGVFASAADNEIEQIYVNKPDVVAYYRASEGTGSLRAYLGGEELEVDSNQLFSETGEAIHYFVLVDISGSINDTRFQDVKNTLTEFRANLRQGDEMLLSTFGDAVTPVLDGTEDQEQAAEKISQLVNYDNNTLLFDAITAAADQISASENQEQKKWVLIIISDGEDYADNTKTSTSTTSRLIKEGIPAYTIAVENSMGYSDQVISQYQGNFSNVATQTGGIAWTPGKRDTLSRSVMEAFENIQSSVLGGYRASFKAGSNRISNQEEQFVLTFPDGSSGTRNVLVNRNQPDQTAPTVSVKEKSANSFQVIYSESVNGAGDVANYLVTLDGKNLGVEQVVVDSETENAYLLIMKEEIVNSSYHFNIRNIKDDSNEENALKGSEFDVKVTTLRDMDTTPPKVTRLEQSEEQGFVVAFSETVKNAENSGNYTVTREENTVPVQQVVAVEGEENTYLLLIGEALINGEYAVRIGGTITDASPEENPLEETSRMVEVTGIKFDILSFILRWWPIVLTVVVLIFIILFLLLRRRIKKKNITVINGEIIEADQVDQKLHVGMVGSMVRQQQEERGGKPIVLWLSNGKDEPKRMEYTIEGSCFVGRSSKMCEIYCDDPMMSKQHFNLSAEADGGIYVTDLGSTNGTAVNGVRIQGTRKLEPGDEITAGNIKFRIEW